jgi:molybdenum cofactor biosynthesis protein B
MSAHDHERQARLAASTSPIRLAVVTVSDTRTAKTDASGDAACAIATDGGLLVAERRWSRDDAAELDATLDDLLAIADLDAIVLSGGTGLGPRDGTVEVVSRRLRLELPGFGEMVRALGWRDVGASTMLSRALGGVAQNATDQGVLVFAMPGSTRAVESVMRELIVPILPHAVWELRGRPTAGAPEVG